MLSQSVCRSARSGCTHHSAHLATSASRHVSSSSPSIAATAAAAGSFQQRGPSVGKHQRRPSSSSSASSPPNGQRPPPSDPALEQSSSGRDERKLRVIRRKSLKDSVAAVKARDEAFANVPAVPSTQHLQLSDVKISDFFALHRPISVTSTFPPQSTDAASFEKLFSTKHRPSDVIYTLSSTAAALDGRSAPSDQGQINWQTVDQSVTHLDGAPQPPNLDQLIKQYRPFRPPPPPVVYSEFLWDMARRMLRDQRRIERYRIERAELDEERSQKLKRIAAVDDYLENMPPEEIAKRVGPHRLRRNAFNTRLQVMRFFLPSGKASFAVFPGSNTEASITSPSIKFARRRLLRQKSVHGARRILIIGRQRVDMGNRVAAVKRAVREWIAISVKRQRKLKMKKHKFKKLMRRTRNLRIREGRN